MLILSICETDGNSENMLAWSSEDKGDLISLNGHCIKHLGKEGEKKSSIIRTIKPIDSSIQVYYYELTVLHPGEKCIIGIGLTKSNVTNNTGQLMPGWSGDSIGYHGDDGGLFHNWSICPAGSFSPYSTGDTVGCCLKQISIGNKMHQLCFFTLNGKKISGDRLLKNGNFFPTIGLGYGGAEVETNLGHKAFLFDLKSTLEEKIG